MNTRSSIVVLAGVLAISSNPVLGAVLLSFEGTVDESGAMVGGVLAPSESTFTLEIEIDDSMAATGMYAINSIGCTLTVGTCTTATDWTGIVKLVATQAGAAITLVSDPLSASPDEHFLLNLAGFGTSSFDDPASWGGLSLITGDIIVRGLGVSVAPINSPATPHTPAPRCLRSLPWRRCTRSTGTATCCG